MSDSKSKWRFIALTGGLALLRRDAHEAAQGEARQLRHGGDRPAGAKTRLLPRRLRDGTSALLAICDTARLTSAPSCRYTFSTPTPT